MGCLSVVDGGYHKLTVSVGQFTSKRLAGCLLINSAALTLKRRVQYVVFSPILLETGDQRQDSVIQQLSGLCGLQWS